MSCGRACMFSFFKEPSLIDTALEIQETFAFSLRKGEISQALRWYGIGSSFLFLFRGNQEEPVEIHQVVTHQSCIYI